MENSVDLHSINSAKKKITLLGFALVIQGLLFNTLDFSHYIKDTGSQTILTAFLAMLPVLLYIKKENLFKQIVTNRKKFGIKEVVVFFAFIVTINIIASYFIDNTEPLFKLINISFDADTSGDPSTSIGEVVYGVLGAPIIEEIIYRGAIMESLKKYGPMVAIISSSVLFGSMHQNISQSFVTMFMGLCLGYGAYKYSLKLTIIIHVLNNIMIEVSSQLADKKSMFSNLFDNSIITISILIVAWYLYKNRDYIRNKLSEFKRNRKIYKKDLLEGRRISYIKLFFTRPTIVILVLYDLSCMLLLGMVV